MVSHMVSVGEETGQLETMLEKIADFYEAEVDAKVKALTSLIEPLMIMFVGGVVGFIVISMYLPIFSLYDNIPLAAPRHSVPPLPPGGGCRCAARERGAGGGLSRQRGGSGALDWLDRAKSVSVCSRCSGAPW